jgi:hypothetical protein
MQFDFGLVWWEENKPAAIRGKFAFPLNLIHQILGSESSNFERALNCL